MNSGYYKDLPGGYCQTSYCCPIYLIFILLVFGLVSILVYKRTLRYLKYYQQEQYITEKFQSWLIRNWAFDKRISIFLLIGYVLQVYGYTKAAYVVSSIGLFGLIFLEENSLKVGKLPLNFTDRAKRITIVSLLFTGLIFGMLVGYYPNASIFLKYVIAVHYVPFSIMYANTLLSGFETSIQNKFKNEAIQILKRNSPAIIGITGSFGKTSTKSLVGEIFNVAVGPTYYPGSGINSLMGIVRDIRERFQTGTKFAVIEMGAYKIGSIKNLTEFSPPTAAIITAVGTMHLERFGSRENIYTAKSELARAVPEDGILVCNGDNAGSKRMAEEFKKRTTLVYGLADGCESFDVYAKNISFAEKGSSFDLYVQGRVFENCKTPLLGVPAISNILAAVSLVSAYGGDINSALGVIASLKPVRNRLELEKAGDLYYLHDAYNSNPVGFRSALGVMSDISHSLVTNGQYENSEKIVMTPGMIELGDEQFQENADIGKEAGDICDYVIIVSDTNKEAILSGIKRSRINELKDKERVFVVKTRAEGFALMHRLQQPGSVALIENDLPDLYEGKIEF